METGKSSTETDDTNLAAADPGATNPAPQRPRDSLTASADTTGSGFDQSRFLESDDASLQDALHTAEAKAQEYYDAFLRAKAEADNVRRRAQEDVSKAHKFGIENFAEALLPVMDSLDAALLDTSSDPAKLREGVELTQKQLHSAFERNRLIAIDPTGEKFDPHRHQAISTVQAPEGIAPSHVVTVLQRGWMLADRVLRPALVTVAN